MRAEQLTEGLACDRAVVQLEVELAVLDLDGRERVDQQPLERLAQGQDQAVVSEGELDRTWFGFEFGFAFGLGLGLGLRLGLAVVSEGELDRTDAAPEDGVGEPRVEGHAQLRVAADVLPILRAPERAHAVARPG